VDGKPDDLIVVSGLGQRRVGKEVGGQAGLVGLANQHLVEVEERVGQQDAPLQADNGGGLRQCRRIGRLHARQQRLEVRNVGHLLAQCGGVRVAVWGAGREVLQRPPQGGFVHQRELVGEDSAWLRGGGGGKRSTGRENQQDGQQQARGHGRIKGGGHRVT